jgi:rare lipoprotein A
LRPTPTARKSRRGRLVTGALIIGVPAAVVGLSVPPALAAQSGAVSARVQARRIAFDKPVVVTGQAPASDAGHTLQLQFLASGAKTWQVLASTTAPVSGSYRLSAPLRKSGFVRVIDATTDSATGPVTGASGSSSNAERVAVAAGLQVPTRQLNSFGGRKVAVSGRLLPSLSGRTVWLQAARGGAWRTLTGTKTRSGGGFTLRFTPAMGSERLRVVFTGDSVNARSTHAAGSATAYQAGGASWYYDAGNTACGFHAYYGVANKSLPCGTRVKLIYGGRSVTATVDDRGPYVAGRDWDLNQNTAAALGFGGIGTVWASY